MPVNVIFFLKGNRQSNMHASTKEQILTYTVQVKVHSETGKLHGKQKYKK
jgi:hypothetical protein